MKVAIIITCFNRLEYLKKTVWSLYNCDLSKVDEVVFINDASTDKGTSEFIESLITRPKTRIVVNRENKGIKASLKYGYDLCFANGYDIVINLDSDALVRNDFVERLIENFTPHAITTGFHSVTKNANGTDRHKILSETDRLYFKQSVGGINMMVDKVAYKKFIEPSLLKPGNWDHNACIAAGGAFCLKESVIEHIGFESSMNHIEQPDTAANFVPIHLPDVTLLCVDNNPDRIKAPLEKCTSHIKFGDVVLLHPDIRSKEAYSQFIINEAWRHVNTSHVLIFQHDGYVNNWQAWNNDWLQYDYIGAPWHYKDGMAVGNGGFSLRSKRLMELCAQIVKAKHPEDHHICRTYRKQLEDKGMKFAPVEVAEKFAFEGYLQPDKFLKDQFGVHGRNPRISPEPPKRKEKYVFGQFLSLGDILFLIPMARALMAEGNTILWPIDSKYLSIKKHFPDINFVDKETIKINYEMRATTTTPYGIWLPYRFANEILGKTLKECMRAKYDLYKHDYKMWRSLEWIRDYSNEAKLIKLLKLPKKFNLVNRYFGHLAQMTITPQIENDLPIIEMQNIEGFTLIDWIGVLERANEIHSANTSLLYILELVDLKCPIHLYRRNIWGEQAFEYTDYLHTKPYILH